MERNAGIVNNLVIGVPVIAMALIGVLARSATSSNYGFVSYDSKQNAAITAYIPIVRETHSGLPRSLSGQPPVDFSRKLAYEWIDGASSGKLPSLQPCSIDDTSHEGVKGDIVRASMSVGEALARISYLEATAGHPDQAAKDAVLGARAVQATKFFDFASLSSCAMVQRRCLQRVQVVEDRLSPETMKEIRSELQGLGMGDDRLGPMAVRERQLYLQGELRHGVELARIERDQKTLSADEFTQAGSISVIEQRIRTDLTGWRYEPFAQFLTEVRLGFESQVITDRKLAELLQSNRIYTL